MPELPDIELYRSCIERYALGAPLVRLRLLNPFVLRSVEPRPVEFEGRRLVETRRIGKRVVLGFDGEMFAVIHLMIAGRFRWLATTPKPSKIVHGWFEFEGGSLILTEASTKKRASVTLASSEESLAKFDRGGLEINSNFEAFRSRLLPQNRTLKRVLTDPSVFAGIGNAYSDEILHAARLSPLKLTTSLSDAEVGRLHEAILVTLSEWTSRLRKEFGKRFPGPGDVTAFRPDFAVHGKFNQPCPVCGNRVQRIVYADNETNYCARCQNEGRILADRALSRLLKDDWPRTLEDD